MTDDPNGTLKRWQGRADAYRRASLHDPVVENRRTHAAVAAHFEQDILEMKKRPR